MSKRSEIGNATFALMLLSFSLLFMIVAWDNTDAPLAEVQAVISEGQQTPEGQALVRAFFKQHPVPSHQQLRQLKKEINAVLVLEKARIAIGDPALSIKSGALLEPATPDPGALTPEWPNAHPKAEMNFGEKIEPEARWLYNLSPLMMVLALLSLFFALYRRLANPQS